MSAIRIVIPPYVEAVLSTLSGAGHRGYLVGGCLRDLLRGVEPHDFDLTTDATPEQMLDVFRDFRVIPTGLRHGTVTVISDGHPVELTTHRLDGAYTDSRRPVEVSFTRRLSDDLSRRDFTVNAMAYNRDGGLVDLFGGQEDLAAGILRAVGDPAKRFSEDALRILRLYRFSAQLDFAIDPATQQGARETVAGLANISAERILGELSRLLIAPAAKRGLLALLDGGAGPFVLGELLPDTGAVCGIEALPPDAPTRLAFLLMGAPPKDALTLCRRLRASNAFCSTVEGLLRLVGEPLPDTPYAARRYVCHHWAYWESGLCLLAAKGRDTAAALSLCRRVVRERSAVELRRLAVNGHELQESVGVAPKDTGALLLRLQDLVWQYPEKNRKAQLIEAARRFLQEGNDV